MVCCAWETAKEVWEQRKHRCVINDRILVRYPFFGTALFSKGDDYKREMKLTGPVFSSFPMRWLLRAFGSDILSHILAGEDLNIHETELSMWCKEIEALVGASLIRTKSPVIYLKIAGLKTLDGMETAKSALVPVLASAFFTLHSQLPD